MKRKLIFAPLVLSAIFSTFSCAEKKDSQPAIKEDNVTYTSDSTSLNGFIAYDENKEGKRPGILVVHEWWGLNDYVRNRAKQLADLGYIALAVDMYGNGKNALNPDEAGKLAMPFYQNPQLAKNRIDAAMAKLKEYSQTDKDNIAIIGYCFGGAVALNISKLGEDVKGAVSFHGNLAGVPADKNLLKTKILVCHGADDKFVSQQEVDQFRHQMDSIGADYSIKIYPNATHAFTNPDATKLGQQFNIPIAYNAEADKQSWNDMKDFLEKIFGK